jgi:F-type H+-transporting ATPase subunit a
MSVIIKESFVIIKDVRKTEGNYAAFGSMILFLVCLVINIVALFPQTFSLTSHLPITLSIAFNSWFVGWLFYGWYIQTKKTLTHLLPQGTPGGLTPFMVLVEITRTLIRPITLCVRLTANLVAGHLLITLLGSFIISIRTYLTILTLFCPILLTILEARVAAAQAYVFIALVTMYGAESK